MCGVYLLLLAQGDLEPLDLVRALPPGVPQSLLGGGVVVVACLAKLSAQRDAPFALLVELLGQRRQQRRRKRR